MADEEGPVEVVTFVGLGLMLGMPGSGIGD
jgi:hypothetical protein